MAYTRPFYRASFLFKIRDTDEIAVTDLSVTPNSGAPVAPDVAFAQAMSVAFSTFLGDATVAALRASYSDYTGCKVAAIGTDGQYLFEPASFERVAPLAGSGTAIAAQNTVVVSLRSGLTLGKGNYGRMYIPHSGKPQGSTPYIGPTDVGSYSGAAAAFIGDVNDLTGPGAFGLTARIMSQSGAGSAKSVSTVAVGRVVDTQRRRRNALTEEYTFTPVP